MRNLLTGLLALGLVALVLGSLTAQEKKEKKKKPAPEPYAGLFGYPKVIKLDDGQKEKVAALKKEFVPKLLANDKKRADILTPARVKAAKEAMAKAKKDGGKGKELTKAYNDSLKLTGDEQKQLAAINKERSGLGKEISTRRMAILTPEQREALKPKKKKGKEKDKSE